MFHNSFNTRTLKVFSFITRKKCQVLSIGIDRYRHLFADFRIFGGHRDTDRRCFYIFTKFLTRNQ